jgi:hypothetical protein
MNDLTEEVTELIDVMRAINKRWPGPGSVGLAEQCRGFYKGLLLLMDDAQLKYEVITAWERNPTFHGAAQDVAKRALELGAPVATVNFLIAVHFGA